VLASQENKSSHNGEDFSHQNLGAANFAEAELKDANLSGCDLRAAIFSRAVLYRANLAGSDLTNAFLDYTVLRGADASGAVFAGANFVRADMGAPRLRLAVRLRSVSDGLPLRLLPPIQAT